MSERTLVERTPTVDELSEVQRRIYYSIEDDEVKEDYLETLPKVEDEVPVNHDHVRAVEDAQAATSRAIRILGDHADWLRGLHRKLEEEPQTGIDHKVIAPPDIRTCYNEITLPKPFR